MFGLSTIGVFLYFLFFISLISISMYVSRTKEVTVESYFFANRNSHWLVLGISFLTSCIISPYILGLTAYGSTSGIAIIYGIISVIMLIVLGLYVAPLYLKNKIKTLPEYFEKRFSRSCKFYLSALYIFYNIFIRLIIILAAGSIFINTITGVDAYSSLLFFLIITGIYTIIGGLRAEIYVNVVQVLFIALGAIGFFIWILNQNTEIPQIIYKISSLSNLVPTASSEFSWAGLLFGLPIIGFWFWCADQFMIQKVLSVRNIDSIKKATLTSAFLQTIPVLIFLIPGIIIISVFQNEASNEAMISFFSGGTVPEGLRGGLIIAVAAILTASFASTFNSTSMLVTFDFYRSFKPNASDRKLVLVGRLTTMILLFCSILLIPVSQSLDFSLCLKLFKTLAYFSSMVAAVFITGLLSQKITAISALLILCLGTIVIFVRGFIEIVITDINSDNFLVRWFTQSKFLEFSIFIFLFSIVLLFVLNKLTWVQNSFSSLLRILKQLILKLKYALNLHKKVF